MVPDMFTTYLSDGDDGRLVTWDFCREELGWVGHGLSLASPKGLFGCRLRFHHADGVTLCLPGVESEGRHMTRGELRRLRAALDMPLRG